MTSDYFDKIYCINLERRKDRRKQAEVEFAKNNVWPVQFVKAVDGKFVNPIEGCNAGNTGCILSHLSILRAAKVNGHKSILIFEDDAEFSNYYNETLQFIPSDYDILFLGGSDKHATIRPITNHIAKVEGMLCTHAYAVKEQVYDLLIGLLENANAPIDVMYSQVQKNINALAFIPKIVFQRASYSDIIERNVRYVSTTNEPNPTNEW